MLGHWYEIMYLFKRYPNNSDQRKEFVPHASVVGTMKEQAIKHLFAFYKSL